MMIWIIDKLSDMSMAGKPTIDALTKKSDKRRDFPHYRVFPDVKKLVAMAPPPLPDLLRDGFFVLDSNAVLLGYSASKHSLEEMRKQLLLLAKAKRLVIPGHVIREFFTNRPTLISNMLNAMSDARSKLSLATPAEYPVLQSTKSFAPLQKVFSSHHDSLSKLQAAYDTLITELRSWHSSDPALELVKELAAIDGVVCELDDTEFDTLADEHAFRKNHRVPPGYKDASKEKNAEGDLIIWKTLLSEAARRKRDAIFVTNEDKPDWWNRANNLSMSPRIELQYEFFETSSGKYFWISQMSDVLQHLGAETAAVRETKEAELVQQATLIPEINSVGSVAEVAGLSAERAMNKWIAGYFGSRPTLCLGMDCDSHVKASDGRDCYFWLKKNLPPQAFLTAAQDFRAQAAAFKAEFTKGDKPFCVLIVACDSFASARRLADFMYSWPFVPGIRIVVGELTASGFSPVKSV